MHQRFRQYSREWTNNNNNSRSRVYHLLDTQNWSDNVINSIIPFNAESEIRDISKKERAASKLMSFCPECKLSQLKEI